MRRSLPCMSPLLVATACGHGAYDGDNRAPVVTSVRLEPSEPTTDSVLLAVVEASDPDGDLVALSYTWTVNGRVQDETGDSLEGAWYFERGDSVVVSVTAQDGRTTSDGVEAQPVLVLNTPPEAPSVSISPEQPLAGLDDLLCTALAGQDADGDEVGLSLSWLHAGESVAWGDTLPASLTSSGDEWTCQARTSDGSDEGEGASATVVVQAVTVDSLDPYLAPVLAVEPADAEPGDTITVSYSGELASAGTVSLYWGWNGWAEVDGLDQVRTTDAQGLEFFHQDEPMTPVEGGHQLELAVPEGARALHMKLHVAGTWDDADGREYHHGFEFPYIGPYLTWSDETEPTTGIVVSWETSLPCLGVVEHGPTPALGTLVAGSELDTLHHVTVTGLTPGSTWYYRVNDSNGRASTVHGFSLPAEDDTALSFLVAADMQDNGADTDRWPIVGAELAAGHGDARFVMVPGDMASSDTPGHWWRFFDGGRDLFASVPMVPALGNHDTPTAQNNADTGSFRRYFALPAEPGSEDYYVLDYANLRIVTLNSEIERELAAGGEQFLWLQDVLDGTWVEGTRTIDWVFTQWHYPPYTISTAHFEDQRDYRDVASLFDGQVDWSFTGHMQNYQRFVPLQTPGVAAPSGSYGLGADDGVGYLVVPSGGDHVWEDIYTAEDADFGALLQLLAYPEPEPGAPAWDGEQGFVRVDVDGAWIHIAAWGMGTSEITAETRIIDEIEYVRE